MADDILGLLTSKYADYATKKSESAISNGISNITNGERLTKDGYLNMSGKWSEENKKFRESGNELLKSYKDQEIAIKNIGQAYKDVQASIQDIAAKNYLFQQYEEEKLAKYKLDSNKQLYDYINDENRKSYKILNEQEAEIYRKRNVSGEKLTEDELKRLKNIQVSRLLLEENGTKKALELLKNEYKIKNDKHKQYFDELDRQELEIYTKRNDLGGEFNKDELKRLKEIEKERLKTEGKIKKEQEKNSNTLINGIKQGLSYVINYIGQLASYATDVLYFDQAKAGMTEFAQAYEQNFTELAGRFGTDRSETHDLIGSGLSTVNNDSVLSGALNYSKDVMPSIVEASKSGFTGEEAIEIGITRALDKKIMPWLDTNSEVWTQLEYNLTDDSLNQIKGQQLLLQETREGNRILQTGIADTLLNELAPTLQAIDANTTTEDSMGAAYEAVEELMARGMDKTSAVKFVKDAIDADQNKFKALTSGDPAKIAMAQGAMNGGGVEGAIENYSRTWGNILARTKGDEIATGAVDSVAGGYLPATYSNYADMFANLDVTGKYSGDNLESSYANAADNAVEKITATQEHDNEIQNEYAQKILDALQRPHGSDIAIKTFEEVVNIKNWLIKLVASTAINGITNMFKGVSGGGGGGASKGLLSNPKVAGGLAGAAGAAIGAYTAYNQVATEVDTRNASELTRIERAEGTDEYEAYKDSLVANAKAQKTGAIVGGAVGVVGGAAAGAAIGSVIPGIGTAIGGLVGGAIGFFGAKLGAAAGDAISPLENVMSEAAIQSLDNLKILDTNWDDEILAREQLVSAMNDSTDIEVQKRLLLDAGIDKNLVSMANTDAELDKLAKQALETAENMGELANASSSTAIEGNTKATDSLLNDLGKQIKSSGDREAAMKAALDASGIKGDARQKILDDIDESWWWGYADDDVDDFLVLMKTYADEQNLRNVAGKYNLDYDTMNTKYLNDLDQAIVNKDKEAADQALKMLKADKISGGTTALDEIKNNDDYVSKLSEMGININSYAIGSPSLPYDMFLLAHQNERILTAAQNKKYTEELISGQSSISIIQAGIQDLVMAIKNQTNDIINYLSTMSFNNSSFGGRQLNMSPEMGNTKVL